MKRYGNIYKKIYDIENLKLAHKNARKDKSKYKDVQMVDNNINKYLLEIQYMLKNHTYKVSKYQCMQLHDRGKVRDLMKLPYFPDRIIQWAIMLQIEPIFMQVFTIFTCASIKNRGIHYAHKLMKKNMKDVNGTKYTLKLDIKKFYPNINHKILKQLLRKKFKDKELLWLLDLIIDSTPGEIGIPIGSYLSQFLANYYLAYFDHWLKEFLLIKYVVRYMDDIVIQAETKEQLHQFFLLIKQYLKNKLKLIIKANWQIFPTRIRGVDFVGYRFFLWLYSFTKKNLQKI